MTVVLIGAAIVPLENFGFGGLKDAIVGSRSYALVATHIADKLPFVRAVSTVIDSAQDPDRAAAIQSSPYFDAVYQNEKIQDLIADEESLEQIRDRDFLASAVLFRIFLMV